MDSALSDDREMLEIMADTVRNTAAVFEMMSSSPAEVTLRACRTAL